MAVCQNIVLCPIGIIGILVIIALIILLALGFYARRRGGAG